MGVFRPFRRLVQKLGTVATEPLSRRTEEVLLAIQNLGTQVRPEEVLLAIQNLATQVRPSDEAERHEEVLLAIQNLATQIRPSDSTDADEPPLEPAHILWREFYEKRQLHYKEILRELGEADDDVYSDWYRSGGYGYDPQISRLQLINETSLADYRGTCLDIGSGDGFWSWLLSEWFHVTGIDPNAAGVELSNSIKQRLPLEIQHRVDFVVGDALLFKGKYDVVFCRAPGFFNFPIFKPFDLSMLDFDNARLREVYMKNDPLTADAKIAAYPEGPNKADPPKMEEFPDADKWREYLERMLALTGKLFVFILSTNPAYYGAYLGGTYNHDPDEVARLFAEYSPSRVRMDSTNTYIIAEIYK